MNAEHLVRDALENSVRDLTGPEPDLDALVSAGESMRRRRSLYATGLALVLALVVVGVSLSWAGTRRAAEPVPAAPSVARTTAVAPTTTPSFLIGGLVHQGRYEVPTPERVAQFTLVSEGFVWVQDESSDPAIRWSGWDGRGRVLGYNPWPSVEPFSSTPEHPRGLRRNVVGNPMRGWLAWVSPGRSGNELVIANSGSGGIVKRTPIPAAGPEWLDVLAVDFGYVHLRRCPAAAEPVELPGGDAGGVPSSRSGCSIWAWEWQRNAGLQPTGHSWVEPDGTVVQDVTSEVWAVTHPNGPGLSFVSPQGRHLSDVDLTVSGQNEGNGLSPNGQFWFSPTARSVAVTATGGVWSLADELARVGVGPGLRFVWNGRTTIAVLDDDTITTCDVETRRCAEPPDVGTLLTRAILPVQ